MKNVTILQSVQEMQKNPLEKADFCGMMGVTAVDETPLIFHQEEFSLFFIMYL